ncbi:MAG: CoB--CoM heterodisulfide reductase iron-sulfur subunit B family protein [Desulfobacterales bacterium]|nr:CoB--CoM heterodisulfide reductase iron-sulfur subunit B family protein [Desulfobacterales bacterium]
MKRLRYLYFPGCKMGPFLPDYDRATRAVTAALGVELVDCELNCCGYPVRDQDLAASVLAAARNLALAAREGLDLMTPCQCCYGQLRHADYWLRQREDLACYVNGVLKAEGLVWSAAVGIYHLLQVLAVEIGLEAIRPAIRQPLAGLDVAAHYGCHALRPGHVMQFDNPLAPTLFENLVAVTGASAVDWPLRLECCGYPLRGKNDRLARRLMQRKTEDARQAGAQVLATACTYCQMQFGAADDNPDAEPLDRSDLPAILYIQLLGRAMGLPATELGLGDGPLNPLV